MSADARVDAAQDWIELGARAVLVDGKNPGAIMGDDWQRKAVSSIAELEELCRDHPETNLGVVPGDAVLLIDVDDPGALRKLEERFGPLPPTPRYLTGGGPGRERIVLRHPRDLKLRKGVFGTGIEVRTGNLMSTVPPGIHPDTGELIEWRTALDEVPIAPLPAEWLEFAEAGVGGHDVEYELPGGDRVPVGQQHNWLVSLAGTLRKRGLGEAAIAETLISVNREHLERPGTEAEMRTIARSAMEWDPDRGPFSPATDVGQPRFALRDLDLARMRNPVWSFELRLREGVLNALCGVGGIGKTTLVGWVASRLSLGELPGAYRDKPVTTLVIGNEDDADEDWTPRIHAAGGDVSRVKILEYSAGVPLDFARDTDRLRELIRKCGAKLVYFDQVLDNRPRGSNANLQHDVRDALQPLHQVARDTRVTVLYSLHPTKSREQGASLRDRAGGSGQWTDMPRNGLLLGWHPDRPGVRVLARGKGNRGKTPPALTFTIEELIIPNPNTGEAIETSILKGLAEEEGLTAEDVRAEQPKPDPGPTKEQIATAVLVELGDDGAWHSRKEAARACAAEDVSERVFERAFAALEKDTKRQDREIHWRLK